MLQETQKLLTDLFRIIGEEETEIEKKRQEISQNFSFLSDKVFDELDNDKDGLLDSNDLVIFMKKTYNKVSKIEAEMIIKEFDADEDQTMSYEEFCNFILPSTDRNLRQRCEFRNSYSKEKQNEKKVLDIVAQHFEKELRFIKIKEEIKKNLLRRQDFFKRNAYSEIANGEEMIGVHQLFTFLNQNGYFPQREHLEAILRRIDHTGDMKINFDEFSEVIGMNEKNQTGDELEIEQNLEKIQKSPEGKKLIKEIQIGSQRKENGEQIIRSNSRQDIVEDSLEEAFDKIESEKKQKKQNKANKFNNNEERESQINPESQLKRKIIFDENEQNQSNQINSKPIQNQNNESDEQIDPNNKPLNFKYLTLIKNQLKMEKEIEIQRQCLNSHTNFQPIDMFAELDKDRDGAITIEDLTEAARTYQTDFVSPQEVMRLFGTEGKMSFQQFSNSILPQDHNYQRYSGSSKKILGDPKQKDLYKQELFEELGHIYSTAVRANNILDDLRSNLSIDPEQLFQTIVQNNLNYLLTSQLVKWIEQNCCYKIQDQEQNYIDLRYQVGHDQRITKDKFQNAVQVPIQEDQNDEEEGGDQQDHQNDSEQD